MKIGLLSDTHNNLPATIAAARLLLDHGVEAVIHCGDIGTDRILDELYARFYEKNVPLYFVLGNCDLHEYSVINYPELDGLHFCDRFGSLTLDGKKIGFLHGDDHRTFSKNAESGVFDYLITGHTHAPHDQIHKTTRLLNPGSAAQSRSGPETCAVLDLASDTFELLTIN
jgi:putative phosphoesterase